VGRQEGRPASATCCTHDFTLEELQRLCLRMDEEINPKATRQADFTVGPPSWRSNAFVSDCFRIVRHIDQARWLIREGLNAVPELKDTAEERTQAFLASHNRTRFHLADMMVAELRDAGFGSAVHPLSPEWKTHGSGRVVLQTFDREVARYWATSTSFPVLYLYEDPSLGCQPSNCGDDATIASLAAAGVALIGAPLPDLVTSAGHRMVPTPRASHFHQLGLGIVAWSLERSGCPGKGGSPAYAGSCGFYYRGLEGVSAFEYSDSLLLMYQLYHTIGVVGAFSDYAATNTAFLNCVPPLPGADVITALAGDRSTVPQSHHSLADSAVSSGEM